MNSSSDRLQERMFWFTEFIGGALKSLSKNLLPHFHLLRKNYLLIVDKTILKLNNLKYKFLVANSRKV